MSKSDISEEDCDEMRVLYYDERYTMREISEMFDCEKEVVRRHLRYECNREEGHSTDIFRLKEKLEEMGMSLENSEYETSTTGRDTPSDFRPLILKLYRNECLMTSVDMPQLLEVAHVLPWSKYPEHRHKYENVMVLNKVHHAAFDSEMFTLSQDYVLHLSPEFETDSAFLHRTLVGKEGEEVDFPEGATVKQEFLKKRNEKLDWYE
jgi:hypothetical protein